MDFEINRLRDIRSRLKKCYAFTHRHDKKRLGYLKSERTSESNPFIKRLEIDLQNRFSTKDANGNEKNNGLSKYTLRSIFFDHEKLNYEKDTIPKLELYCEEIETEISKNNTNNNLIDDDRNLTDGLNTIAVKQEDQKAGLKTEERKSFFDELFKDFNNPNSINFLTNNKFLLLAIFTMVILVIGAIFYTRSFNQNTSFFDPEDTRYKILILPFDQQCMHDGSLKNVGKVIELRLEELSAEDDLNLNVRYVEDFELIKTRKDSSWTHYYQRIIEENHVNQLIYGRTREENCSVSGQDEICLGYMLEPVQATNKPITFESNFSPATIPQISKGLVQENIDMQIYVQAALAVFYINPTMSLNYLDRIKFGEITLEYELEIRYFRSEIFQLLGYTEDAVRDMRYIKEKDKNNYLGDAVHLYIDIKLGENDYLNRVLKLIKEQPNNWQNYYFKAFYFASQKDSIDNDAINKSLKNVKSSYGKSYVYSNLAQIFFSMGKDSISLNFINKAIQMEPQLTRIKHYRSEILYKMNKYKNALEDINIFLESFPNDIYAHFLKARILLKYKGRDAFKKQLHEFPPFEFSHNCIYFECLSYFTSEGLHDEVIDISNIFLKKVNYRQDVIGGNIYLYKFQSEKLLGCEELATQDSLRITEIDKTILDNYYKKQRILCIRLDWKDDRVLN
jgi:hypothetical protein